MLPKINAPIMTMVIPSTGKKVKYTNFTVKEQKSILLAAESDDHETLINTLIQLLENCVEGHDFSNSPLYDLEFAFARLRTASVGGMVNMKHICGHEKCETENEVQISIADLKVREISSEERILEINSDMSIQLKHLNAIDTLALAGDKVNVLNLYSVIPKSVNLILNGEDVIEAEQGEELDTWCDDLPETVVADILKFIQNTPRAEMQLKYVCTECKHEHDITLTGLDNFLL